MVELPPPSLSSFRAQDSSRWNDPWQWSIGFEHCSPSKKADFGDLALEMWNNQLSETGIAKEKPGKTKMMLDVNSLHWKNTGEEVFLVCFVVQRIKHLFTAISTFILFMDKILYWLIQYPGIYPMNDSKTTIPNARFRFPTAWLYNYLSFRHFTMKNTKEIADS